MTATSYNFGHRIYYDEYNKVWRWADNHRTIKEEKRKCPRCDQSQTKEGYDRCAGYIERAVSFCCGHGVKAPVLIYSFSQEERMKKELEKIERAFKSLDQRLSKLELMVKKLTREIVCFGV